MRTDEIQTGVEASAAGAAMARAAAIMARLREPDGCPWDREQTFDSIKRYTLEETYEVFDAIERRDWPELRDELGDLLLQVLFYAQMASEAGYFTLQEVADNLTAKLLRRHPHVFGEVAAEDAEAVLRNWEQIKREEKRSKPERESLLDEVPRSMPAVMEAAKLGSKAGKVGFDWPDSAGLFAKMDEELAELRVEVEAGHSGRVEAELGDLLFTAVNLARHLKVDPEGALRGANAKFRARFGSMERAAGGAEGLEARTPQELEELWNSAKSQEQKGVHQPGGTHASEACDSFCGARSLSTASQSAALAGEVRIEALTELEQFDRCVDLQDTVWGYERPDAVTQKVFLLASRIGGQVIGAFHDKALVGYAMSLPGVRNRHPYLHSHHLAVLPEWRNAGLGRRLKLAQRDDALRHGIELMEWTFDPLEIKNTYLNIARLGAVSRRYLRNFYGRSSSPLQGGLPTDRLVAEWWLRSARVEGALRGKPAVEAEQNSVSVPAAIYDWKASPADWQKALELQARNALSLEEAFAQGQAVIGYKRLEDGSGAFALGRFGEATLL